MIQVTICVKDSSFVTYLMSFVGFEHEAQSSGGNLIISSITRSSYALRLFDELLREGTTDQIQITNFVAFIIILIFFLISTDWLMILINAKEFGMVYNGMA